MRRVVIVSTPIHRVSPSQRIIMEAAFDETDSPRRKVLRSF